MGTFASFKDLAIGYVFKPQVDLSPFGPTVLNKNHFLWRRPKVETMGRYSFLAQPLEKLLNR